MDKVLISGHFVHSLEYVAPVLVRSFCSEIVGKREGYFSGSVVFLRVVFLGALASGLS